MSLAHSRTARHQRIVEIIARLPVRSQGQMLELLAQDGYDVTQATLSRDLVEIGAVKIRHGGVLVYAVPGEGVPQAKLKIDTLRWQTTRLAPKTYGDRAAEGGGRDDRKVILNIQVVRFGDDDISEAS